jgi:hypothetical protein
MFNYEKAALTGTRWRRGKSNYEVRVVACNHYYMESPEDGHLIPAIVYVKEGDKKRIIIGLEEFMDGRFKRVVEKEN